MALTTLTAVALLVLLAHPSVLGQKWKTDLGPCYRDCAEDPEPRVCHYVFHEEIYAVLTGACKNCSKGVEEDCYSEACVFADGVERSMYSVNRQLPGPGIHVCRGDTIVVDLEVGLPGHAETIHWHGMYQRRTPWFDGVAYVTQCPTIFGSTFRYKFVAEPAGTFFWHSHSGVHKVNGVVGPLIVKEAFPPHGHLYDYDLPEHVIFLQDWMHVDAEFVMPGLASRLTGQPSDGLLINGQGNYKSTTTNQTTLTPLAKFEIRPGKKYRFRIINSGSLSCPIQLQFEGHRMTVISSDGFDIRPRLADSLVTFSGERYDVVIEAKRKPTSKAFWIYARTVGFCQNQGGSEQKAVLQYQVFQKPRITLKVPQDESDAHSADAHPGHPRRSAAAYRDARQHPRGLRGPGERVRVGAGGAGRGPLLHRRARHRLPRRRRARLLQARLHGRAARRAVRQGELRQVPRVRPRDSDGRAQQHRVHGAVLAVPDAARRGSALQRALAAQALRGQEGLLLPAPRRGAVRQRGRPHRGGRDGHRGQRHFRDAAVPPDAPPRHGLLLHGGGHHEGRPGRQGARPEGSRAVLRWRAAHRRHQPRPQGRPRPARRRLDLVPLPRRQQRRLVLPLPLPIPHGERHGGRDPGGREQVPAQAPRRLPQVWQLPAQGRQRVLPAASITAMEPVRRQAAAAVLMGALGKRRLMGAMGRPEQIRTGLVAVVEACSRARQGIRARLRKV